MSDRPEGRFGDHFPHDDAAGMHGVARDYFPKSQGPYRGIKRVLLTPATWIFFIALAMAYYVGKHVPPTWVSEKIAINVLAEEEDGRLYYVFRENKVYIGEPVPIEESPLSPSAIAATNEAGGEPPVRQQFVVDRSTEEPTYYQLKVAQHWRYWSLLPALVAVLLCFVTREPLTALFGGIVIGAFVLGRYNLTEQVLVQTLASADAAGILILYLWLLGGLLGIWSRTGAAQAFAEFMARHFVRGPRSAKFTAWMLGVIFFQGGTMSAVLVGTTVRPLADKNKVSHEELSYIVDSTSSPIAGLLAFNAWPAYVQAFIFIPGVAYLATEADRIAFFFKSVPFSFYSIFAVLGTLLLCFDKAPILGKKFRTAIKRTQETGELDGPGAMPLSSKELQVSTVPEGYRPHVMEFFVPLFSLIGIAVGTFYFMGSPQVRWAFGAAVLLAFAMAMLRGMPLQELMNGYVDGLKGVVLGSVILMLALTIGNVSKEAGGGLYLVDLLGTALPYWLLPVLLQILTIIIAFSTGTSFGTFAVTFPLAMPLALAVAGAQGVDNSTVYLMICFAAVLNGSIFGDQCSPISDTTVLSAMSTGCDLMDHVKTQIVPASVAAILAAICWTAATLIIA